MQHTRYRVGTLADIVLTAAKEGGSVTMRARGRWARLFHANKAAWVMHYCVDVLHFLLRITGSIQNT